YLLAGGEDLAEESVALGKMAVEKDTPLTDPLQSALASATDVHEVNLVIRAAFADDQDTADAEFAFEEGEGAL
ncbi:hypothetical protein ACWERE_37365, partial [Rhodococcus koreensis]